VAYFLGRGRTVIVPVLKHSGRINDLASALEQVDLSNVRALVVDDEADQTSLNTKVAAGEQSRTYAAIARCEPRLHPTDPAERESASSAIDHWDAALRPHSRRRREVAGSATLRSAVSDRA
jgi:hypothetical protein